MGNQQQGGRGSNDGKGAKRPYDVRQQEQQKQNGNGQHNKGKNGNQ